MAAQCLSIKAIGKNMWLLGLIFISLWGNAKAFEWSEGDVILISLPCYLCRVIELETGGPFSHGGIVLDAKKKSVAQALDRVEELPLEKFFNLTLRNKRVAILRPVEFLHSTPVEWKEEFYQNFAGLEFDNDFLWNNYDDQGQEKLYCSEFLVKYLNRFLQDPLKTTPMSYRKYASFWRSYYQGDPPEGRPGFNPNSFYHSKKFKILFDGLISELLQ